MGSTDKERTKNEGKMYPLGCLSMERFTSPNSPRVIRNHRYSELRGTLSCIGYRVKVKLASYHSYHLGDAIQRFKWLERTAE